MSSIEVEMPGGGDEKINAGSVFVIRDATDVERDEAPDSVTCIWGGGFRVYPAETLSSLIKKFSKLNLARVTSPGGMPMYVNAENVTDRNDRSTIDDHVNTRSVLLFGSGANAPRLRVRETQDDLVTIWEKLGVDTDALT